MSVLRFFLDRAPAAVSEFDWALYDEADNITRTGRGGLAGLPRAERIEAILAASLARLARINLPRMSAQQLQAALSYALEDQLAGEPEASHVTAGQRAPDGSVPVAVVSKAWLAQALTDLREQGITLTRMLPESCLPHRDADEWLWVDAQPTGFVVTDEGASFTVDYVDAGLPPALALALDARTLAAGAPVRVRCCASSVRHPALTAGLAAYGAQALAMDEWDWRRSDANALRTAIDLLSGEFSPGTASPVTPVLRRLRPALWIAGAALALHVLASIGEWVVLAWDTRSLHRDMHVLYQSAFGEAPMAGPPEQEFTRRYASARHARGEPAPDDALPLLARAAPVMQQLALPAWRTLTYSDRALTLEYPPLAPAMVRELQTSLRRVEVNCLAADFEGGTRLRLGWSL